MQNNDLIPRATVKEVARNSIRGGATELARVFKEIDKVPAIDAAPVVRCKDCRYYNTNNCGDGFGWCERNGIGHGTSDDWFCADGERVDAPTCGPDYCEIGGDDNADGETQISR